MLKGAFSEMKHTHRFETTKTGTKMTDIFEFRSPFGFLGKLANFIFLKKYMTKFLLTKNEELKIVAESDRWKEILKT